MEENKLETTINSEQRDTIFGEEDKDKAALAEINFDLIDAGRWLLKVIAGPNSGAEFSMHSASSYVIGTDPSSCDIVFHDNSVSRQHARITVGAEDGMTIEDLKSRNQTLIDGEAVKTKRKLAPNTVITVGTTSFTIYDREGEMHTIISPLLPAIVKVLQKEESVKTEAKPVPEPAAVLPPKATEEINAFALKTPKSTEKTAHAIGAFIVLGIIAGLFAIIGLGTAALFRTEPVIMQQDTHQDEKIAQIFTEFPSITPYFNKSTGTLQLMGHVRTQADKTRLLYAVQGLPFVKSVDDSGIIIDEFVWQEINQVLAKNPNWRSISVQSPTAGKFILSGYLQTRNQSDQLSEYIAANFPYLDLLEKRITVEEDVVNNANTILTDHGLINIAIKMSNRELTLTGGIPLGKEEALDQSLADINKIPGVRSVKNLTTKIAAAESMVNISDRYEVTGFSRQGSVYSVVVHGHILSKGDELDGMHIKEITPSTIFLEKDNINYRIDFSH